MHTQAEDIVLDMFGNRKIIQASDGREYILSRDTPRKGLAVSAGATEEAKLRFTEMLTRLEADYDHLIDTAIGSLQGDEHTLVAAVEAKGAICFDRVAERYEEKTKKTLAAKADAEVKEATEQMQAALREHEQAGTARTPYTLHKRGAPEISPADQARAAAAANAIGNESGPPVDIDGQGGDGAGVDDRRVRSRSADR